MLSRDQLKELTLSRLIAQPEVFGIYFFGREAEGCADEYSDLDMVICTNDLQATQSNYRGVLSEISPIVGTLLLESDENHFSEIVALKSASPYQKLDFSVLDDIDSKRAFAPFRQVFMRQTGHTKSVTRLKSITQNKDAAYLLNDILFSIPRFTKCLFRADFDMYRRWRGVTTNIIILLYEKYFGWQETNILRELTPQQTKQLYGRLNSADSIRLSEILPITGYLDITTSFMRGIDFFVSLSKEKAEYFNGTINAEFVNYMTIFLRHEIERYHSERQSTGKGVGHD